MVNHPDAPEETGAGDLSVALDTLTADDGTNPSVGDEVDVSVKGKVSRIDQATNCAYVTPTTCNDQPPPDMENGADDQHDQLMNAAQSADDNSGY